MNLSLLKFSSWLEEAIESFEDSFVKGIDLLKSLEINVLEWLITLLILGFSLLSLSFGFEFAFNFKMFFKI